MNLNVQKNEMQNHQQTAQKLLDHSSVFKQIFQDQWFHLWALTPQNLWVIDQERQQLLIADGLLMVQFLDDADFQILNANDSIDLVQFSSSNPNLNLQKIADFILNEITFLIRNLTAQNSLFLQSKVQLFRQLLVEEAFAWVDGENRVEQYLYNINLTDAEQLDRIMIEAGYYEMAHVTAFASSGIAIPLSVELNFKHLSLVNSILGDNFLSVQQLIPLFDQLCFSAQQFIPPHFYRIIETAFDEQFNLAQVIQYQSDFKLLINHAKEQPKLLAFSQWIKRGYWQYNDIFSKKNFIQASSIYWDERISVKFPLFYFNRNVNWLFKQDAVVIDWVANQLDDVNVRIAVTALSFIDSSQIHPQIILHTLDYFKSIAGRLFIQECSQYAQDNHWFSLDNPDEPSSILYYKHSYTLRSAIPQVQSQRHQRTEISDSILYIEEWLHLLYSIAKDDQRIAKQVFNRLSRVMQAFMLFLQKTIQHLPEDLIAFIHPNRQQDPKFSHLLHDHQISVNDFRQRFKHPILQFNRSTSVFDSYVADYLVDYFYQHRTLAKNVTWSGLYQQAVRWHQHIHFEETLSKLRLRIHKESWRRVAPQEIMFSERWKFIELNSLEQIIHESVSYKHCLALSYTERIADGEYVAFHMSNLEDENIHLTLGCHFKFDQLHFDQLRLPNNEQASQDIEVDALAFVKQVNQHLIWDFKETKIQ